MYTQQNVGIKFNIYGKCIHFSFYTAIKLCNFMYRKSNYILFIYTRIRPFLHTYFSSVFSNDKEEETKDFVRKHRRTPARARKSYAQNRRAITRSRSLHALATRRGLAC